MQTASSNFALAISASSGTWAQPQVHADWDGGGYSGDNSIDDLSPLAGRPIQITHSLDDGMPGEVTTTADQSANAQVTMPVGGATVAGVPFSGPQYWSVDNTSSPLSGYHRDTAALTVAHGPVTASGIERVTIFTGQLADVEVTGRSATLKGISATRLKLTANVQPPAIAGDINGLDATWPVSWALYKSGIYASPTPRAGCRAWIPCHGSLVPFIDSTAAGFTSYEAFRADSRSPTVGLFQIRPTFIDGPYVSAAYAEVTATQSIQNTWNYVPFSSGADFLSQAGSTARIEFWVRGDAANTGATPIPPSLLVGPFDFVKDTGDPNTPEVTCGIGTDRKVFVTAADGAGHKVTLKSAGTLPTDGAWYFVGAAWSISGKKLWVDLNGTVGTSAVSTFVTSSLPATDTWDPGVQPGFFNAYLPVAEVHFTSGAQANPDNYPWLNSGYTWTQGAIISPSLLSLVGLAEQKPREAWEFIASFAQAELAMTRTDELDRFNYLPRSYWAETVQQTVVDAWSTQVNAGKDFSVTRDPTKIRNQVTVNYTAARVDDTLALRALLYIGFTVWTIPPSATVRFPIAWGVPVIYPDGAFTLLTAGQAAAAPFPTSYVCLNSASDGSGSYATSSQVTVSIESWNAGTAVLKFVNLTGSTWYTASAGNAAFVQVTGASLIKNDQASITVNEAVSQSARGVRGLTVDLPAIQDQGSAQGVAYELLSRLRSPRPELKARLHGDPRRQPGDLVTFADPGNTGTGGQWRPVAIETTIDGADVTQDVTAVKAVPVGVWDTSTWDDCVWGP